MARLNSRNAAPHGFDGPCRAAGDVDDLGFARVDLARSRRQGVPEVVYGAGKTASQISAILGSLRSHGQLPALVTRIDAEKADAVSSSLGSEFAYFPEARAR